MTSPVPWWHPTSFARRKPFLDIRQQAMTAIRSFFAREGFAEVDTPALQKSPGAEVHLHAFSTKWQGPLPGDAQRLFLQTSPEFAMKKLLVAGVPKHYQFAHVYRNGERSSQHHPEFMVLEWYRTKATIEKIMSDCEVMIREVAEAVRKKTLVSRGIACDPFKSWEKISVAEAFFRYANIDLLATAPDPKAPERALLAPHVQRMGLHVTAADTWDDLFFRIMSEKIEPNLGKEVPAFLYDYPVSMAALARPKPSDPRLAERFELYICGVELANAFRELTDAQEQRRRLVADMAQKQTIYGATWPVDEDFLKALEFGLPECSGIALGVDRLIMLVCGAPQIEDVLWAPVALETREA